MCYCSTALALPSSHLSEHRSVEENACRALHSNALQTPLKHQGSRILNRPSKVVCSSSSTLLLCTCLQPLYSQDQSILSPLLVRLPPDRDSRLSRFEDVRPTRQQCKPHSWTVSVALALPFHLLTTILRQSALTDFLAVTYTLSMQLKDRF